MSTVSQEQDALEERVISLTARRVRMQLAANETTKSQAAAALGLSPAGMTRRLSGQVHFTVPEVYRLAAALGIDPAELLPPRSEVTPLDRSGSRRVAA